MPMWIRIRTQHLRSMREGPDADIDLYLEPDPGFWWPKISKILQLKKNVFWSKIAILLNPKPPQKTSKLHEKPSALKREHPILQNMKFRNFFYFCGGVIFALLDQDPDPADQNQCGSGSETMAIRITINNIGLNTYHTHLIPVLVRIQASNLNN